MHDSNYARTRFSPCHGRIRADSRTVTLELTPRGNRRKRMKINSAILLTGAGLLSALSLSVLRSQPHDPPGPVVPKDMLSSEPLFLPQYQGEELGKLEYPSLAADAKGGLHISYDYTGPDGKEGIYLTSLLNAKNHTVVVDTSGTTGRLYLRFPEGLEWTKPVLVSSTTGEEYASRIAVENNGTAWVVWSARRKGTWDIYVRTS